MSGKPSRRTSYSNWMPARPRITSPSWKNCWRGRPISFQLVYAAEMITTIILGLESLRGTAETHGLRERLEEIGKVGELGLGVFSGLGMGLSVAERVNRRLAGFLLVQSSRFQSVLLQLSDESRRQLAEFAHKLMQRVEG